MVEKANIVFLLKSINDIYYYFLDKTDFHVLESFNKPVLPFYVNANIKLRLNYFIKIK